MLWPTWSQGYDLDQLGDRAHMGYEYNPCPANQSEHEAPIDDQLWKK